MAQADEIARDIVVALLTGNQVSFSLNHPEQTGENIGKIYVAVLQAVRESSPPSTPSTPPITGLVP